MSYFVIGLSGVTCGGKTTMAKLLQKSFPWAHVIHQDKYFWPEDYVGHKRVAGLDSHINFDTSAAIDMEQMERDVQGILGEGERRGGLNGIGSNAEIAPNFAEGLELLRNLPDIDVDTSKYGNVPILIVEGFIIYESEMLFENCDIRFFLTLDEDTCRHRRSLRVFDPPDGVGYFDSCIWPEYERHFKNHVEDRSGAHIVSGKNNIGEIWKNSVDEIMRKLDEKYGYELTNGTSDSKNNASNGSSGMSCSNGITVK